MYVNAQKRLKYNPSAEIKLQKENRRCNLCRNKNILFEHFKGVNLWRFFNEVRKHKSYLKRNISNIFFLFNLTVFVI